MGESSLGFILGLDGSIRDLGIIATTPEGRRKAQDILFMLRDQIDRFEIEAKARLRGVLVGQRETH